MKGNFQTIMIVVFIVGAVFGILVFSGMIKIGNDKNAKGSQGTVVLWGTVSTGVLSPILEEFNKLHPEFTVQYAQKNPENFDTNLLEALASGKGPDMFFLPDKLAYHYRNRIFPVPYTSFPVANFKNTFAGAGEVFMTQNGILAFPILVDPLVMYYNRSHLDANSIVNPPAYWDEFVNLIPVLNKKDSENKIIKSAIGLGQFSNINNAKDILATLFMQIGNNIMTEKEGTYTSAFSNNSNRDLGAVLSFFTGFADPSKDLYSWNKALPKSQDFFSSDDLTFYFGFSSELSTLISKNPNQNFLVAPFPQIRNSNFKATFSHTTGIAVSAFSKNPNTAFTAASLMSTGDFALKLANALRVVPARRDLLKNKPVDAYFPTFYNSALFARSFLDPSPEDTNDIFRKMIDSVLSNSMSASDAVLDAGGKFNLLLAK